MISIELYFSSAALRLALSLAIVNIDTTYFNIYSIYFVIQFDDVLAILFANTLH